MNTFVTSISVAAEVNIPVSSSKPVMLAVPFFIIFTEEEVWIETSRKYIWIQISEKTLEACSKLERWGKCQSHSSIHFLEPLTVLLLSAAWTSVIQSCIPSCSLCCIDKLLHCVVKKLVCENPKSSLRHLLGLKCSCPALPQFRNS